jgi:transposase-like protein
MTRDPLAAFDDATVEAVARDHGVAPDRVRALVRRHQELVRRLPGVDDIVYEWRRGFPNDPVVERRPGAYYLSVAEPVWPEFVAALSLDDREASLLQAVHRRQLRAAVGGTPTGDRGALVLTRE